MLQVSLAEKIGILGQIIISSPIFICIAILSILLNIALYKNKNNKKTLKKVFTGFYISIIIGSIITYGDSIIKMLDYLVEHILKIIYFPDLASYIIMIIIANIIMFSSLISNSKNYIKLINTTVYSLIMLLFLLILYTVVKNNINVYEMFSIYTNKELLVLIELSSSIIILWIIIYAVAKLIDIISIHIYNNKTVVDTNESEQKDYNGPLIDEPIKPLIKDKEIVKNKETIFSRINNGLDKLVDSILGNQKAQPINYVSKPETVYSMPTIEKTNTASNQIINSVYETAKSEFTLPANITKEECIELRKRILELRKVK